MTDEFTTSMSVPLDSDGFLRRQCPTCEREFKWLNSPDGAAEPVPDGGYHCPYCEVQAPAGSWHTEAQVELAKSVLLHEAVAPELQKFSRDVERSGRGGLISFKVDVDLPPPLDPLTETDDMRRVDFTCHPREPVKVLDDWDRSVRCLVCGRAARS
jgi:hypothetical protein